MDENAIRNWAQAFEGLTPRSLDHLIELAHPDIHFTDPFNDVRGRDALRRIFEHMFETCDDPKFTVIDVAIGRKAAYVRWRFTFTIKSMRSRGMQTIDGMSEVVADEDGLISAHYDHWDAASGMLAKLPFVGAFIRWLLCKFAV